MFIFDWLVDWAYGEFTKGMSEFLTMISGMGAEIFDLAWIKALILFFDWFGFALFVVGLLVAAFECAIEMQSGKASFKDLGLNAIKGFMAVGLFTTVPVELYKFAISLQNSLSKSMATAMQMSLVDFSSVGAFFKTTIIDAPRVVTNPLLNLLLIIAVGYCVIKIFFANIKRGGILVINIAVGSLYMFSVPRGYMDGFQGWCKQVIGICLTAFLQNLLLIAGLITWVNHPILGTGLMLSAGEVPRIAGAFGLDTSAKVNVMSSYYAAQAAIRAGQSVMKFVAKKAI